MYSLVVTDLHCQHSSLVLCMNACVTRQTQYFTKTALIQVRVVPLAAADFPLSWGIQHGIAPRAWAVSSVNNALEPVLRQQLGAAY